MRIMGKGSCQFGEWEFRQTLSWLFSAVLTVILTNGAELLGVFQDQDGWRSTLSAVYVVIGRGLFVTWRNNRNRQESINGSNGLG
jgi:hypothetical protein